jgi:FKBP-type peptidyl-prolyl cis-trans isomerase FklB
MKSLFIVCLTFLFSISLAQTQKPASTINTPNQRTSYGFGVLIASNLRSQAGDSLDLEAFFKGIKDSYQSQPLQIKQEECSGLVQQHIQTFSKRKADKMRKGGVDFLEKNKKEAGITTTASGLQYKVVNTGSGKTPGPTDKVTVHYHGTLIDGMVFDSSVKRGQPTTFGVNQVIRGWTEALQLMKEGDKWILYIPQELAYGANGSGQIPPYSTLIFEVELIKVN